MIFGDPLKKALASADPAVRAGAVRTIGQQRKQKYSDRLLEMLEREGTELKIEVAAALGLLGEPSSIAPLATLLSSPDRRLRAAAAQAMHKIQETHPRERLLRPSYFLFSDHGVTFLMIVLDVFDIRGKGTVATGVVGTGTVAVGDRLILRKADGRNLETVCEGVERPRPVGDVPSSGEDLGVFLRGLSMDDVDQGDSLVKEEHSRSSRTDEASDSYEMTYSRYRHLAIEGAKPAPTERELQEIEELLGAKLPLSFREYLKVANGGSLEYVIDVPTGAGETEPLSFSSLFSAEAGTFCDETFMGEIRSGREHAKIPKGVLPFARDGGGSIVYLDLTPEGNGRVVAFVHGLPEWAGKRTESAFLELAPSFDEYVDKLRIDLDAVVDHLEYNVVEPGHVAAIEEWLDIGLPNWRDNLDLLEAVAGAKRRIG